MSQQAPTEAAVTGSPSYVDAFLSYSRVDRDAARSLAAALEARGRSLWVDWEGIPPTAEWMQEIHEAIQRSDAVIFVLSPDSASSPVCGIEVDQALAEGKRIIPVVVRDVHPDDVSPELAKRQWIRLDDDVEATADALVAVLDVDLDSVKQHTRLTVKSAEWESHERDRGRLLRGSELAEAEQWLAAPGRGVSPTQTVTAYVLASRQAAARRQRTLVSAVSAALVVALALGAFAFVQRRTAEEQRDVASTQALASASLATLSTDPQTSLLLALEADKAGSAPVVDEALRRSVLASDVTLEITPCDPGEPMGDIAFAPDGSGIWTSCVSRGLQRFDTGTGNRVAGGPGTPLAEVENLSSVATPVEGRPLMVASFGAGVKLVDQTSGAVSDSAWTGPLIYNMRPSRDGSQVAVANVEGIPRLLDSRTGALLKEFPASSGELYSADLDPSGARLAASGADGNVDIYDTRTSQLLHRIPIGSATGLALWSPSGKYLLTTSQDRIARIWDTTTWTTVQLLGHNALINDAAWAGGDGYVVTADSAGGIRVWSVASGDVLSQLTGHREWVSFVAVSPDGTRVASASEDGTVRIWRWGPGLPLHTSAMKNWATGVAMSPDGSRIATAAEGDGTVLLDAQTGARISVLDPKAIAAPAYSPDGTAVLVSEYGTPGARVRLIDTASGAVRWVGPSLGSLTEQDYTQNPPPTVTRGVGVKGAAFSPDGTRIALMTELGMTVLDAATGAVISTYAGEPAENGLNGYLQFAPVRGAAWTTDGASVVAPDGNDVVVIDAATGREKQRLTGHTGMVNSVAASPDGRTVVSTSEDTTARVWDLTSGLTRRVLPHQARALAVAFSSHGLIATTSRDGNVSVWDPDGTLLMRTRVATIEATGVAWAPDGRSLAVAAGEGIDERVGFGSAGGIRTYGSVQVLDCPVCLDHGALVEQARSQTIRSISQEQIDSAVAGTLLASTMETGPGSAGPTPSPATPPTADIVGAWTGVLAPAKLSPDESYLAGPLLFRVLATGKALVYSFAYGADHGTVSTTETTMSITTDNCGKDVGTYTWAASGSTLTLTAKDDPCAARKTILTAGSLTRPS